MARKAVPLFTPKIAPDLEHASAIREEALDWLERQHPGRHAFTTGEVLRMAGEPQRRWLISRLRARDIGNESEFSLPDTADALTALFLRSKGVKFSDAVDAVVGGKGAPRASEPRYGGVWSRLIIAALEGLRRRVPARLLAAVVFALLPNPDERFNCLVIVKRRGKPECVRAPEKASQVTHDYVYRAVLERPAPSCSVVTPSGEVMFFAREQLPARSEVTSRHFSALRIETAQESYELMLGTMKSLSIVPDGGTLQLAGRVLDIIYLHFESFVQAQLASRLETPIEPEQTSASDLQLWLITQFLTGLYTNCLCEISQTSPSADVTKVLASSAAKPWEPSPLEPAKGMDMLSGYAARTGVPLVVEKVEPPWSMVIEGIEAELRYLKSQAKGKDAPAAFSSLALPVTLSSGQPAGALYMLMPRLPTGRLETEVRILSLFSRVVGETMERYQATVHSAEVTGNIVSRAVLGREPFQKALLDLLNRKAREMSADGPHGGDMRLPFLLVSVHSPEPEGVDAAALGRLKGWLVQTLRHLEWRSFLQAHWPGAPARTNAGGFVGEVPGIGIMLALGKLVSKDELDQIRNAFPSNFNRTFPTNSPVKLVAWALDVPAQRILDAVRGKKLAGLADEIENWAFDVATLVDDLAQSSALRDAGEWDASLKKIRQALQKRGARHNSYLRRLAADCSLALADWPGALKYAREAVALSGRELGSGLVRSLCMEGDAHLCLAEPLQAWDLYSEAAAKSPHHPLPRYYRGEALLLLARLLRTYREEQRGKMPDDAEKQLMALIQALVDAAIEDLTAAADLLDKWGLIPESYQYRNFHLVPTLLGQALGYLLTGSPGPAASRLQSARRSFPKDDLFFREFLFAKCWEQGVHRQYAALFLGDGWAPFHDRLQKRSKRS